MASAKGMDRRSFIKSTAATAAAMGLAARRARGAAGGVAPSDRLNVACVGLGFQGMRMMSGLLRRPDVRIVAVCDPNTDSSDYVGWGRGKAKVGFRGGREVGRKAVEAHYGRAAKSGTHKGCKAYADFREMLANQKDLDAVHIITPDHLHATIAIAAMKAGKHAATHKPISNVMHETHLAIETARKTKLRTHLLAWIESRSLYVIREWVRQGVIGPVREVHRWLYKPIWPQGMAHVPAEKPPVPEGFDWQLWLGPERDRPYSPQYTHAVYRAWYDFGGGCLADMGNYGLWRDWRILGLGAATGAEGCASYPCEVIGWHSGTVRNDVSYPRASTIRLSVPAAGDRPACEVFWYDGGMRPRTPDELIAAGREMPRTGVMFVGDKGKILAGFLHDKPLVLPEKADRAARAVKVPDVKIVGGTEEWVGAFRGGRPSRGSFENARHVAEAICLGNLAVRLNTRLEWDPVKMRVTNRPDANRYLRRNYRKGWELA